MTWNLKKTVPSLPLAAVVSLLLSACPGATGPAQSDAGSTVLDDNARSRIERAIDDLAACSVNDPLLDIYPGVAPQGLLIGRLPGPLAFDVLDASDDVRMREAEGIACAEALEGYAETCDVRGFHADDDLYDLCDTDALFEGTRAEGEACEDNPYACVGYCDYDDDDNGCANCAPYRLEGEGCDFSERCEPSTQCRSAGDDDPTCVRPGEVGDACPAEECVDTAYCLEGVCAAKRGAGEPCETGEECLNGCAFANGSGSGVCGGAQTFVEVAEGEACQPSQGFDDDESVGCDYYEGITCLIAEDSEDQEGVCTPFEVQQPGEPCDGPWAFFVNEFTYGNRFCGDDDANYCHFNFETFETGECRTRPVLGEACQSASLGYSVPCNNAFFCANSDVEGLGECVEYSEEGEPCQDGIFPYDYGCALGLQCEFDDPSGTPTCRSYEAPMCMAS